jgi:hypothetical protein
MTDFIFISVSLSMENSFVAVSVNVNPKQNKGPAAPVVARKVLTSNAAKTPPVITSAVESGWSWGS